MEADVEWTMKKKRYIVVLGLVTIFGIAALPTASLGHARDAEAGAALARSVATTSLSGESRTLLADGRWLVVGGEGAGHAPTDTISVEDPTTGSAVVIAHLGTPRAWHSASVLPTGQILVVGGIGTDGDVVVTAELFDPTTSAVSAVGESAPTPRAFHSATTLLDGAVVFAGGLDATGAPLPTLERWNAQTGESEVILLPSARYGHVARLLPDGEVLLWGGLDVRGVPIATGDLYDPRSGQLFVATEPVAASDGSVRLEESVPSDGAVDVPTDAIIGVRFSEAVMGADIVLEARGRTVTPRLVPAEGGMEYFVIPDAPLRPGTKYLLRVRTGGTTDVRFTTSGVTAHTMPGSLIDDTERVTRDEGWTPDPSSEHGWTTGRGRSTWQLLPPLQAPKGVTALAGQALRLDGSPIAGVRLDLAGHSTKTDATGRFLLTGLPAGHGELAVDGGKIHGFYEIGVDIVAGVTTALPYTIWLTKIDWANAVDIPSPTTSEFVVTSPVIPGLEVRIPPDTVLRDHNGEVVTKVTLTAIPLDRPPFPLANVKVPLYFTFQPGGSYVANWTGAGARIIYPNRFHEPAATRFDFWHYDPDQRGWYVYGRGRVSEDREHVVPNPGVGVYEFTGAMAPMGTGQPTGKTPAGDPVDLTTGAFVYQQTDFVLPDTIPIVFTRTLRTRDTYAGPFGLGGWHSYEMFMARETTDYNTMQLILGNGQRVRFLRLTGGSFRGTWQAGFEQNEFSGAILSAPGPTNAEYWNITLPNGTVYTFPESSGATRPAQAALVRIVDRFGNRIVLTRDANSNLTRITSPSGRYIDFTYNANNRITFASDNAGRTVTYHYDPDGHLDSVTDVNNGITQYTYDPTCDELKTVEDARQITYLTNTFGSQPVPGTPLTVDCLVKQQVVSGQTYTFDYTPATYSVGPCNPNCALGIAPYFSDATVTYPDGTKRKVVFGDGFSSLLTTNTEALGTSLERTTTYGLSTNLYRITDDRGRKTDYSLDSSTAVTSVTFMAGTGQAKTITASYDSQFHRLTSLAMPGEPPATLAWNGLYDVTVTDPTGIPTIVHLTGQGTVAYIRDALGNQTSFFYELGDLTEVHDAAGGVWKQFVDVAGRPRRVTDPLGRTRDYDYDNTNAITQITYGNGDHVDLTYDPNGNLTLIHDQRGKQTEFVYNTADHLQEARDPLYVAQPGSTHKETFDYDERGNIATFTDRLGAVTRVKFDRLNRPQCVRFSTTASADACQSPSLQYTFDDVDRLQQIVSASDGSITRVYDDLDFMTSEASINGTVTYTPNPSTNRRATMSVPGFASVSYQFDHSGRLMQLTQGANSVIITPDAVGRRGQVQLPNGVKTIYGYDAAGRISSLQYQKSDGTVLGGVTYTRDAAGGVATVGGNWARTGLPAATTATAVYDDANRLALWNGGTVVHDNSGEMTTAGGNTFVWDDHGQLGSVSSSLVGISLAYDPAGRRRGRIVNTTATSYLPDGLNVAKMTTGSTSSLLLEGLRLDDDFAQIASSGGVTSLLRDQLGSTVAVTDSTATVTAQYTYEPFGATTVSGTGTTDFQFAGRENNTAGFYYNRARYYSPTYGRFLSEDPLGISPRAPNLYSYVGNNPIDRRDPTGLCPLLVPMSGGLFNFLPEILPEGAGEGWTIGEPTDPSWQGNSFFSPDGIEFNWVRYARSHASEFPNGYWHVMDWNTGDLTRVGPYDTGGFGGAGGLLPLLPFGGRKPRSAPRHPPGWPCT